VELRVALADARENARPLRPAFGGTAGVGKRSLFRRAGKTGAAFRMVPVDPDGTLHLEELDEISAFVAGLGTGGTLMGNGRRLKETFGDACKIVAAEPMQGEPVQGLRSLDDGFIPPIIDLGLLDRKIFVTNQDAIVWTRKLLDEESLFAGVSSGAIASIAVCLPEQLL